MFELSHNLGNGHVFLPADKLIIATAQMLGVGESDVAAAIDRLHGSGRLVRTALGRLDVCYLPEYYEAETEVARRLRAMADRRPRPDRRLEKTIASDEHLSRAVDDFINAADDPEETIVYVKAY